MRVQNHATIAKAISKVTRDGTLSAADVRQLERQGVHLTSAQLTRLRRDLGDKKLSSKELSRDMFDTGARAARPTTQHERNVFKAAHQGGRGMLQSMAIDNKERYDLNLSYGQQSRLNQAAKDGHLSMAEVRRALKAPDSMVQKHALTAADVKRNFERLQHDPAFQKIHHQVMARIQREMQARINAWIKAHPEPKHESFWGALKDYTIHVYPQILKGIATGTYHDVRTLASAATGGNPGTKDTLLALATVFPAGRFVKAAKAAEIAAKSARYARDGEDAARAARAAEHVGEGANAAERVGRAEQAAGHSIHNVRWMGRHGQVEGGWSVLRRIDEKHMVIVKRDAHGTVVDAEKVNVSELAAKNPAIHNQIAHMIIDLTKSGATDEARLRELARTVGEGHHKFVLKLRAGEKPVEVEIIKKDGFVGIGARYTGEAKPEAGELHVGRHFRGGEQSGLITFYGRLAKQNH